ncbi:MAG: hypothetical protein DRQ65_00875 [Gammaproteobacteria bacterium]|nr:MAG: hypothetical protein DRQ65_00875 [Gammaproteobacteria bacterium]
MEDVVDVDVDAPEFPGVPAEAAGNGFAVPGKNPVCEVCFFFACFLFAFSFNFLAAPAALFNSFGVFSLSAIANLSATTRHELSAPHKKGRMTFLRPILSFLIMPEFTLFFSRIGGEQTSLGGVEAPSLTKAGNTKLSGGKMLSFPSSCTMLNVIARQTGL